MSTSSRENRFIATIGKPRRSPPGDVQGSVFFTGQVPNTYTTPYTQPRSSPGRYDLNPQAFYGPWPSGSTSPQLSAAYHNYETSLSNYTTTAYPSRTSSPVGVSPDSPEESRRLPPPTTNVERWPGTYVQATSNYQTGVRSSPTYAHVYPNYNVSSPTTTYSYPISPQEHTSQPQPQLAALQASYGEMDPQRSEPRPSSPYNRNAANTQQSSNVSVPPPPPTANTTEEPTIKKKRKRADANQLKVLNETYARTAFPSTEERLALAKLLDMSPRSVQIWFQNKRQSMRQTNRQSSSTSSTTHHSFTIGSQVESYVNEMGNPSSAYDNGSVTMDVPYLTAQEASRPHNPHTSSAHQRIRGPEENESRRWSRGY